MRHVAQRFGFLKLSRGMAVLLLIAGAIVVASFWIGPFRPLPARLSVVVTDGELVAPNTVRLGPVVRQGTRVRFPLVVAARNAGARAATPSSLDLSLPTDYRLVRGVHPVEPETTPGNPLARYRVNLSAVSLPPDSALYRLLEDTLWIEPHVRDFVCTAGADSIPEFVPSPERRTAALAQIPVFYSFAGTPERQTGSFMAVVDSTLLRRTPSQPIPEFPMYTREPEAPRPQLGVLRLTGIRATTCGDPYSPASLQSGVWETAAGGRLIVLYLDGVERKHLFDLNGDSVIELEMWDQDRNGRFEAWRQASYPIPAIVLPERLQLETVSNDSLVNDPQWLTLFDAAESGPFRFLSDSARLRRAPRVAAVTTVDTAGAAPRVVVTVDSAWLRTFNNAAAGPFRFLPNARPRLAQPPVDTTPPPPPATPRNTRPRPLGTPVPFPGPGGR